MEFHVIEARLGVVVVGVGFIAGVHVGALAKSRDTELVGVVDADSARAAAFSYAHGGVRWATDLDEALAWPDCDAVIVCTPNHTHTGIVLGAVKAGKHVLVEKPLATTIPDASAMVEAADRARVVLMAAHTHRFYDYGRTVKRLVDDGEVGRPTFGRLTILGDWIWPDWSAWMIDAARSGGHALHNGVHLLDLMAWWIGAEPVAVKARGRKLTSSELDIYDYLEMTMAFDSGATAVCEMSRGHRTGTVSERELVLVGTDGMIEQDWDEDAAVMITSTNAQPLSAAANDGFAAQLTAWRTAIDGGPVTMTAAEGLRAVRLGVAVEQSIVSGRAVNLAEAEGGTASAREEARHG